MSAPGDPKDLRFRPFRAAAWAVYLVVSVGFSSLIIYSVFRSVLNMTPDAPRGGAQVLAEDACAREVRALFLELEGRRQQLAQGGDARTADQRFIAFRLEWLRREKELEARCVVDGAGRQRLARLFATMERVLDLYTTATVQFSGGVGPAIDDLRAQLEALGSPAR